MLQTRIYGLLAFCMITRALAKIDRGDFAPADIIEREVAVIGGGAAGSHAAVRIREYYRKSVVVIEKEGNLVMPSFTRMKIIC